MCGISGFVAVGEADPRIVDEQLKLLHHRGPDAAGRFGDNRAYVAQNRLAVIDLETGDPPITNENGTVGAVLNGEIYNFRELREELEATGHVFHTHGDTEVIAHLAEEEDAVGIARRLDGMFSFAAWDAKVQRLILGRDRLGKKPLYYCVSRGMFVFGSEIKAVLAHPAVSRELDEEALPAYLSFGYVPTPRTFFRGVVSLAPGHVLTVEPGRDPEITQYWSPVDSPLTETDRPPVDAAAFEVQSRLKTAVRKRLIADVPLGAFLSGGLDSSLIVALMAQMVDRPVQTFTIGFDDRHGFDERPYARLVAQRYGTDHHEFVVQPKAVDLVERLVWHHDQPFGDSSAVPTFLLNELTRSHVTVALSGDGGDELFAGYERFAAALTVERYRRLPRALRRTIRQAMEALPRRALRGRVDSAQRFTRVADLGLPRAYLAWLSYFTEPTRKAALPGGSDWAVEDFERRWQATAGRNPLDRLLELNLETYLVDDLLVKADRMSMAHALEVRSPFLDADLVSYAAALPAELKLRGFDRKRVLKAAAVDLLPREILRRRKRGFGVPLDRWFREDLSRYVSVTLGSRDSRVRQYLLPAVVDRLLHEHDSGARDRGQVLWLLLTLEVFLRREGW
jgi:asparagine synthase (glutamine-hydrolysing)